MTEQVRNELEESKGNLHVGFNYNRLVSKRLHFKTGARYLSMGYKTKDQILALPGLSDIIVSFTYDYQFIEIPLNLRYDLVENKDLVPFH